MTDFSAPEGTFKLSVRMEISYFRRNSTILLLIFELESEMKRQKAITRQSSVMNAELRVDDRAYELIIK